MQADPIEEWHRLTEHYRQMNEAELRELALDFADLTETAQQALRQEMRSRGMSDPQSPESAAPPASTPQQSQSITRKNYDLLAGALLNSYLVPSNPAEQDQGDDSPAEYTWKTLLCECSEVSGAQQLSAVLERAGIESWIEAIPDYAIGVGNPRLLVAADQLDRARAIAAKPIPQEIIDKSKEVVPEFQEPKCPKCGSDDVVLEDVEPENTWRCEQCGAEWAESAASADDDESGSRETSS